MPVSYSTQSTLFLHDHVKANFGDAEYFMQMFFDNGFAVEIDMVRPSRYRNFYTLVTRGLGAHLNTKADSTGCRQRVELTFYLPADWRSGEGVWTAEESQWPIELLRSFIEMAITDGVGLDTLVGTGEPFSPRTQQCMATLIEQVDEPMRRCEIEGGEMVDFLSIFVIYAEEAEYLRENGGEALMQTIDDDMEIIQVAPLSLNRKNVLSPNNKQYWLKDEKPILQEWFDGPYCYASDSIMVDGKPIGFCYRVEPDETDTLGWDSGWRFFAADDDEEYRSNPKNIGNFELNSLCNVDGRILPLLHSPYGSAFRREGDGPFVLEVGTVPAPLQKSLLDEAAVSFLKNYDGGAAADFFELVNYLRDYVYRQVDKGTFTLEDARCNLELSLWYAYACINCDSYEQSFEAVSLLPFAENYALGSGVWYYRYACALTHCGQLKKALKYAEKGVAQQPEYPWIWLKLGRLRAHFGDKEGAMEAVERGLALVPGNYEFLTLQHEVNQGASIEQMEFHVIDPEADQRLQDGTLESCQVKKKMVAGLVCNTKALAQVKAMFAPLSDYVADVPYCTFTWNVIPDEPLVVGFSMNEAALSKMDLGWLWELREKLDGNRYRRQTDNHGVETILVTVMVDWNRKVDLIYQYPDTNKLLRVRMKV